MMRRVRHIECLVQKPKSGDIQRCWREQMSRRLGDYAARRWLPPSSTCLVADLRVSNKCAALSAESLDATYVYADRFPLPSTQLGSRLDAAVPHLPAVQGQSACTRHDHGIQGMTAPSHQVRDSAHRKAGRKRKALLELLDQVENIVQPRPPGSSVPALGSCVIPATVGAAERECPSGDQNAER